MVAEAKQIQDLGLSAFLQKWLNRVGPILGLVLVISIFYVLTPGHYLSPFNLRVVLGQTVIVAIGAIGMTMIIVSGGIDLSVGSSIALTGVITAVSLNAGLSPAIAVTVGILAGGSVGLVNGLVITGLTFHVLYFVLVAWIEILLFRAGFRFIPMTAALGFLLLLRFLLSFVIRRVSGRTLPRFGVVPFIATLGMLGVARGFPKPAWLLLAPGVWVAIILAVIAAIVLRNTVFGRRVFALGSNEVAARACGIATDRLKIWIYGLAGLLFGLAGVMQMSRLRQGDPTVAAGTELDVIAAVVIGGGSLSGGEGTIFGSMIGALIMAFLRNGCQQIGWHNYVQEIIIGAIIVIAVAVDRWRSSRVAA